MSKEKAKTASDKKSVDLKEATSNKKLSELEQLNLQVSDLQAEVEELKDKNLRIFAEFDNHRKRTAKERLDLVRNAGADIINALLPSLDDFDRGLKHSEDSKDKEGMQLVYTKLRTALEQFGLKEMKVVGEVFDVELHEALSEAPAESKKMKGKILDEIEKGYFLNEMILRHAKVVVGK